MYISMYMYTNILMADGRRPPPRPQLYRRLFDELELTMLLSLCIFYACTFFQSTSLCLLDINSLKFEFTQLPTC